MAAVFNIIIASQNGFKFNFYLENSSLTNNGNGTTRIFKDLKVYMEDKNACDKENDCPNLSQFRDFYYNVQKLLLKENNLGKKNKIYDNFIKNNIDETESSIIMDMGDDRVEKIGSQERKCQSSFEFQCQKLVSDFMFINMNKVSVCYLIANE